MRMQLTLAGNGRCVCNTKSTLRLPPRKPRGAGRTGWSRRSRRFFGHVDPFGEAAISLFEGVQCRFHHAVSRGREVATRFELAGRCHGDGACVISFPIPSDLWASLATCEGS